MINITRLTYFLGGLFLMASLPIARAAEHVEAAAGKITISTLTAIPDGNYLVELQIRGEGKKHKLNLQCKNGALKCVNTDEPLLADWTGRSMLIGNGVFMVQLAGASERATQFWVFNAEGSAAIKEVPDRGEKQTAIPVKGDGLEKP